MMRGAYIPFSASPEFSEWFRLARYRYIWPGGAVLWLDEAGGLLCAGGEL